MDGVCNLSVVVYVDDIILNETGIYEIVIEDILV